MYNQPEIFLTHSRTYRQKQNNTHVPHISTLSKIHQLKCRTGLQAYVILLYPAIVSSINVTLLLLKLVTSLVSESFHSTCSI